MSAYSPGNDIYDGVLRRKIDHSRVNMRVTRTDKPGQAVIEVWETGQPPHYLALHDTTGDAIDLCTQVIMQCGLQPLTDDQVRRCLASRLHVAATVQAAELVAKGQHPSRNGAEWSAEESLEWWWRMLS